jgi:hypothetical protein
MNQTGHKRLSVLHRYINLADVAVAHRTRTRGAYSARSSRHHPLTRVHDRCRFARRDCARTGRIGRASWPA